MLKRVFSAAMFILLLTSMLTLAFNVQPVRASGTIYIRADGSIDPPTAPISTVDNITYTFTGDINNSIVIERDNIVVDGAGYTLQGTNAPGSRGTDVTGRSNVTIKNTNIKNYWHGIYLYSSSNYNNISGNNIVNNDYGIFLGSFSDHNSISGNTFTNGGLYVWYSYLNSVENNTVNGRPLVYLEGVSNYTVDDAGQVVLVGCENIRVEGLNLSRATVGVELWETSNSTISGNNITNNGFGIWLVSSSNNNISGNNITANNYFGIWLYYSSNYNSIFHNNFMNNAAQVISDSVNVWDDGYPSGGNYWSDYTGADLYSGPYQNETGSDGIGDTPQIIDSNNTDHYPLMNPLLIHDVAVTNVTSYKTVVGLGYGLNISVTVENHGNYTETVRLTVYANTTSVESQNFTLPAGNSMNIIFTWNTTSFTYGSYTLSAYAWPVLGETDTSNNQLVGGQVLVSIPGDINGDFTVDIYDAIILAGAYNSKPGDPNWKPNADINGDNTVDIYDAILLGNHNNQHYP